MNRELESAVFEQAINASRNGIVITDATHPDHPIIFANRAFLEMTGYEITEVLGKNCRFLQQSAAADHSENLEALKTLRSALRRKKAALVQLKNYRKNGEAFWNELSISPVFNASGELIQFIGVQSDITRQKEAEAELGRMQRHLARRVAVRTVELRRSNEQLYDEIVERRKAEREVRATERKYRSIFENAVEGIYQSTPEGKYLSVNPALARMYGYASTGDLIDSVADIAGDIYVDPQVRQRFRQMIEADGEVRNLEYQVRRRDGRIIWISESARVVKTRRGTVLYYEGTVQDITRRKEAEAEALKLERQLHQAQKMEAIGTLAGGIAHDFNNILGAIIGYIQLVLDDLPSGSHARQNAEQVLIAGRRARQLVQQILAFSRQSAPEKRPARIGELAREALKLLRSTMPPLVRVEERVNLENDHVVADPVQMHQVIMNLCTNAIHAMRASGGVLEVRLEAAGGADAGPLPSELAPGSYMVLSIRDTGHGIKPEILERIFEPFFTTKPVGEGTGLGLSVVHGIVRGHNGAITVRSAPGAGTTFLVYLPQAAPEPARGDLNPSEKAVRSVLVVDDEELLADYMAEKLERMGFQVSSQTRSGAALEAIRAAPHAFDLIVTDQTMPDLSGLDFAREVRSIRKDLPIILCTGADHFLEENAARAAGVAACLAKPVEAEALSRALRQTLAGSAPRPEQ